MRDLIGQKFGRLLVVELADKSEWKVLSGKKRVTFKCECDCGSKILCPSIFLTTGKQKSCGCISKEKEHFACKSPIHRTWSTMITRCCNKNHEFYYLYGGRGISVCDEWKGSNPKGFSNFYDWAMRSGYEEHFMSNGRNFLTLDRIDTDKGYSPDNCRWIPNKEQQNNKRADKEFTYDNETKTIKQWLKQFYFKCNDYYRLLRIGLDNKQVLDFISSPDAFQLQESRKNVIGERYIIEKGNKRLFDKFLNKFVSLADFN